MDNLCTFYHQSWISEVSGRCKARDLEYSRAAVRWIAFDVTASSHDGLLDMVISYQFRPGS